MTITAKIEAKKGTNIRYEKEHLFAMEMSLHSDAGPKWPANYGYIENTYQADGDEVDIFVLGEPVDVGQAIEVTPFAILEMIDDGKQDDKVLAIPVGEKLPSKGQVARLLRIIEKRKPEVECKGLILDDAIIDFRLRLAHELMRRWGYGGKMK